jgi:hypothetical protein
MATKQKAPRAKQTAASKKRAAGRKRASGPKRAPTGAKARAAAVKKILLSVEKKMESDALKATLGDYIRLIQLQKEMTVETPSDITVTWIEPKRRTGE